MRQLLPLAFLGIGFWLLAACAGHPLAEAETPEQKAWALYGTFVVHQEQAAVLIQNPAISPEVKERIRAADKVAHPLAQSLFESCQAVIETRRLIAVGNLPAEDLAKAQQRLAESYSGAVQALISLIQAVKETK